MPETNTSTRVAIYARVSTSDKGQQIENQLQELRSYAKRQGWRIVKEYTDHKRGSTLDRPGLHQLREDATRGKFETVLVWRIDRLARVDIASLFALLAELRAAGVAYHSYTEQMWRRSTNSTADRLMEELILAIMTTIAALELESTRDRIHAGLSRAKAEGKTMGRPKRVFHVEQARERIEAGEPLVRVAAEAGISESTLRRRLAAAKN